MKYRTSSREQTQRQTPPAAGRKPAIGRARTVSQPNPQSAEALKSAQLEAKMAALAEAQLRNEAIIDVTPDRPSASDIAKRIGGYIASAVAFMRKRVVPFVGSYTKRALSPGARSTYVRLLKDRRIQAALAVSVIVLLLTVLVSSLGRLTGSEVADDGSEQVGVVQGTQIEAVQPDFPVAQPEGTTENDVSVRFDPTRQTASYAFAIGGVPATLSQQKLDQASLERSNFLLTVAQSFGLSLEFPTDKGPMFIGSNSQESVTTATFQHDGFLFFIRGDVLDEQEVIQFINSLQ